MNGLNQVDSSLSDGVNDTLVVLLATIFFSLIIFSVPFIYAYFFSERRSTTINPSNQATVDEIRQTIKSNRTTSRHLNENTDCPICLAEVVLPIETNCGHLFCASCVVSYWTLGNWYLKPILCPVCRQRVTIFLRISYKENVTTSLSADERQNLLSKLNEYNRRFSGEPRSLMEHLRDMPTLLRHCFHAFFSINGLAMAYRIRMLVIFIICIVYILSPIDIIPEAVFGILGFFDDILILIIVFLYVAMIFRAYASNRDR